MSTAPQHTFTVGFLRQTLTGLATIESQLEDRGYAPERQILEFAFEPAPRRVRRDWCAHLLRYEG